MNKTIPVSPDGETWYACPPERFREMLADESFDCLVDLTEGDMPLLLTLKAYRALLREKPGTVPTHLYGIPVVVEENIGEAGGRLRGSHP